MALSSGVILACFFWDSRTPRIISGVKNGDPPGPLSSPSLSGGIVGDGDLIGDATWDALSSSVSCFEPFLVTLFVACNRAMVSVFVLSSGLVVLSIRSFGLSRVCVAGLVKVSGSDKLLKYVRVRLSSQYK